MLSETNSLIENLSLEHIPTPAENLFLCGHSVISDFFVHMIQKKKIPHAFIFLGSQGIGKATFAFHLIRHLLNAKKEEEKGLGIVSKHSSVFRQVALGVHPSFLYISSSVNRTLLSVNEIRRIDHFLSTKSTSNFRIILIDYADDMHNAAANALLKNLEEPPEGTMFILISSALNRLSLALRSRCQTIRFNPLILNDFQRVCEYVFHMPPTLFKEGDCLFTYAKGSPRKAMLFMQGKGSFLINFLEKNLSEKISFKEVHEFVESFLMKEEDKTIVETFHDSILYLLHSYALKASAAGALEKAKKFALAWQETQQQIVETHVYNLDKRQHAFMLINRLASLRV